MCREGDGATPGGVPTTLALAPFLPYDGRAGIYFKTLGAALSEASDGTKTSLSTSRHSPSKEETQPSGAGGG